MRARPFTSSPLASTSGPDALSISGCQRGHVDGRSRSPITFEDDAGTSLDEAMAKGAFGLGGTWCYFCPGSTSTSDSCHTGESPAVSTLKP